MNGRADTIGPTAPTGAGVRVLFSRNFLGTIDETHTCSDYEGRILYIPIKFEDSDIQLLNVYAPNVPKECGNFF